MKMFFLLLSVFVYGQTSFAKLNVVTTVTDLKVLVAEVGGALVQVDSLAKGTQDPHYIEAKPSFMLKASKADLVVSVGLDLEVGWLPSILQGARNPRIQAGSKGNLELGPELNPLEVPTGKVTRAEGDVHPFGNPHFTLDPIRMGEAAVKIAERLGELDPANKSTYEKSAKALQARLTEKTEKWRSRIQASGHLKVVTYHQTLTYFLQRMGVKAVAMLEPKPGIPPTSGHILDVIKIIQNEKVALVLVENYFDPTVTKKIKESVPNLRTAVVAVSVEGNDKVKSLDDLYEALTQQFEAK